MALSARERKARQRERNAALGMRELRLDLTANERRTVANGAAAAGFEDQTEYIMMLVYKDTADLAKKSATCPDCLGWGCFSCCSTEAEIRARQGTFG